MNSRRYAVASIAIAFMAVTLLSVPGFGGSAYAAGGGMSVSADANYASGKISVSGTTDRSDDVVVKILKSDGSGTLLAIAQVTPSGGSYSATIGTGGSQFSQDGVYTITARQAEASLYNTSAEIEVIDGHVIPEFGTIAVMILVVAIVAIVTVSAKSRLSLVQRF